MAKRSAYGSLLNGLASLYSPRYPVILVEMLQWFRYRGWSFLSWYWRTSDFSRVTREARLRRTMFEHLMFVLVATGMLTEVGLGALLVYYGLRYQMAGGLAFGAALIIAYPVLWAHVIGLSALIANLLNVKRTGKELICLILESQVRELRRRHHFTVVAVAGSVGKTSTKLAIAQVLARDKRVCYQEGNFNDRVTVPLVIFGQERPGSLYNIAAWLRVFASNWRIIRRGYNYDIAVVELGTDGPGQIAEFTYLKPDIAVVTAVAPEHMEFFGDMDAVAKEELAVAAFSRRLLCNGDDIDKQYLGKSTTLTYGLKKSSDYSATYRPTSDLRRQQLTVAAHGHDYKGEIHYLGQQGAKVALAAVAVADMLGVPLERAIDTVGSLQPFAGRMQILGGKNDSTLIDDSYNASPLAVIAALDVLYGARATQRIALLGSMNELGASSREAHEEIGAYCDPQKLDIVVTLGAEANQYIAPTALERGCLVVEFTNPYLAGQWVSEKLKPGTVVLVKGSQNGVFAEEALKSLLARSEDQAKLVRQSRHWLAQKHRQFRR